MYYVDTSLWVPITPARFERLWYTIHAVSSRLWRFFHLRSSRGVGGLLELEHTVLNDTREAARLSGIGCYIPNLKSELPAR